MFVLWGISLVNWFLWFRREGITVTVVYFASWRHGLTPWPPAAMPPDSYTLHRADRSPHLSGKSKGGGVCFYINHQWCCGSSVLSTSCSPDVETWLSSSFLFTCRGSLPPLCWSVFTFHLKPTLQQPPVTSLISFTPSRPLTLTHRYWCLLDDLNHAKLSKVLPKYKQQIKCATYEGKTWDCCYSTISEAYHAVPHAPLGFSDHSTIFLLPSYRLRLKSGESSVCAVRCWDVVSGEALRGCLECTDWQAFGDPHQNIHKYTDVVTSYIRFCEELCVPSCRVKVFPNNKPWFSPGLWAKLRPRR